MSILEALRPKVFDTPSDRSSNGVLSSASPIISEYPVTEYCGRQRTGKSTIMTADIMTKVIGLDVPGFKLPDGMVPYYYPREKVFVNYQLDIKGVNCYDNEHMLWWLTKARRERITGIAVFIDEASQPPLFYARNSRDTLQTELVTSLWQMPKKKFVFGYTSNIGNSCDVQMRDATWITVYFKDVHSKLFVPGDVIRYRVIFNYEMMCCDGILTNPWYFHQFFNSAQPIT
jgi:hypothetical protein